MTNGGAPRHLRSGQLARAAGVPLSTVRYYERAGLLPAPRRTAKGYRLYDEEALRRLRFVRRAKDLGFTLGEIEELLALRAARGADCATVRQRVAAKRAEVERRIAELRALQRVLRRLEEGCPGEGDLGACPVIELLERDEGSREARTSRGGVG